MANLATCSGAHERQDVAPAWLADASAPGGGGAGWPGGPVQRDPVPPPPPPPPPPDTHPLKRAMHIVTARAEHSGQFAGRAPVPPPPPPLTPPCALLLEPPQSSGAGKDPPEFSLGDSLDSSRPRPRWDYWVLAGDPVCPDTGVVLSRAPWPNAAYLETGARPVVGAQGVGSWHSPECDEAARVLQQAPSSSALTPPPTLLSEPPPISPPRLGHPSHSQAVRTRFFGDRCECGRDLEFDPAMRPGLPTWCCKDCQGIDRRHSAECNRERSDQRRRRGLRPAAFDRDPWDTRSTAAQVREENLRSPWIHWLTPSEIKKEAKSDRQRRQDGFCS